MTCWRLAAVLALAATAGCRAMHEGLIRQRLLPARLLQAELPRSLAEIDAVLADRPATVFGGQCLLCLASRTPTADGGAVYCLTSRVDAGCVKATPAGPGKTRLGAASGVPPLTPNLARELWRLLDPDAAAAASSQAVADVAGLAADEEDRFEPRWSLFGGARAVTVVGAHQPVFALGVQAGVRRWLSYFLLAGAGLEYENVLFPTRQVSTAGAQVRVELSIWDAEDAAALNLPGLSLAMVATPLLAFGSQPTAGMRATVGFYLRKVGTLWTPISFELGYQSLVVDGLDGSGFRAALGFGL